MSTSVLVTKLFLPPPRSGLVLRTRLIERLNEGAHRSLTLISAPPGFGKTTLVSEWVAQCGRPVAWLSLDEADSDPTRFLTYLVAALQTIAPDSGARAMGMLQSPQPPPAESVLTALLNGLSTVPDHVVLVLDDYHLIDAKPVDDALTFLVEHLPPQLHLIVATREDPQLPLSRWRVRGQLTELRAADLRFSPVEVADFLSRVMGLDLSAADIAAMEDRTEGWIAGLQLAALSLRGRPDVSEFIRAFAGNHRYILDYLVDEVLQRQPEPVRRFLLQTAILGRLNGPLCDAVTGQADGSARLDALERGNFFVVPLDDRRHWYRYHHLFADVLHAQLLAQHPEQVPTLHRRASEWYEQNGLPADAIHHALAAEEVARAADLVELAAPGLLRSRQEATVLGWLRALPDAQIRIRPVLSNLYAGVLLQNGQLQGVDARLRDAERWVEPTADEADAGRRLKSPPAEMVVVDEEAFRRLPGSIAVHRAGLALVLGNVAETVTYARRALDLVPEDDQLGRGAAAALLGLAAWWSGDLEPAYRSYAEGMASLQRAGHIADVLGCAIALADIRIAQGRLQDAMRIYEQALQLAAEQGGPVLRGTADMYVGMSEVHREQGDLAAAMQDLERSQELGEHTGLPQNRYRWRVAMARARESEGDLAGALDLLNEAERLYVGDFFPNVRPIAALKARVWTAQGRLDEAFGWVREQGLSPDDEISYRREFEHITLARVLLAQTKGNRSCRSIHEAVGLLERLLQAAEDGGRTGSAIEILVLQALAKQVQGDIPAALVPLERALTLAEPERYVRIFVDEGEAMLEVLRHAAARGIVPAYTRQLLSAFTMPTQPPVPSTRTAAGLIEPLSARETEVLRLVAAGMRNQEIADQLFITLATVKRHIANAYGKLGVSHRTEALARANDLHLL